MQLFQIALNVCDLPILIIMLHDLVRIVNQNYHASINAYTHEMAE